MCLLSLRSLTEMLAPVCAWRFYSLQVIQPRVIIDTDITLMSEQWDSSFPKRNIVIGVPLVTNTILHGFLLPGFRGRILWWWHEWKLKRVGWTVSRGLWHRTTHMGIMFPCGYRLKISFVVVHMDSGEFVDQPIRIWFARNLWSYQKFIRIFDPFDS